MASKAKAKSVGKATRTARQPARVRAQGTYDAAQTTDENKNHWANADHHHANVLNDHATRQLLRDRSRYEARNNNYYAGLIDTLANDLIGTGPRLQLNIPGVDRLTCRVIENAWANWARAADFAEDLRVLHKTTIRDGEAFALLIDNPGLTASGQTTVTLDLGLYEAEQVADPFYWRSFLDPLYADGIRRDKAGNPTEYTFLKQHPGGVLSWLAYQTEIFPANKVLHWYSPDRPGQARGVPKLTPGLPLFSQLRRYTLATLGTAEFAASVAGILKTDQPTPANATNTPALWDAVEMVRNALLTTPHDWEIGQLDPKQPAASYEMFKREILNEIGRGAGAPLNGISGNSSPYNFSSAKLDERLYFRCVRVERSRLRHRAVDRTFLAWVQEAALARAIPPALPPVSTWSWECYWDGFDSIDPVKDAQAAEIEKRNGLLTDSEHFARKGQDWEEVYEQLAREKAARAKLGLPEAPTTSAPKAPAQDLEPAAA